MADLAGSHEGPVETVIQEIEHVFEPKAGGIVANARAHRAQREAAEQAARESAEPVQEPSFKAVKVVILAPEITATNTVSIPAGGTAMILPNNEYRYRATIKATAAIVLAKDSSQALGQVGYPLASTDPPLVVNSRAQLWAFAAGATVVSVLVESYGPNA